MHAHVHAQSVQTVPVVKQYCVENDKFDPSHSRSTPRRRKKFMQICMLAIIPMLTEELLCLQHLHRIAPCRASFVENCLHQPGKKSNLKPDKRKKKSVFMCCTYTRVRRVWTPRKMQLRSLRSFKDMGASVGERLHFKVDTFRAHITPTRLAAAHCFYL